MPSHDYTPRRRSEHLVQIARDRGQVFRVVADKKRRNRKRPEDGGEAAPVEPNRPNNLTGGAAAVMEFDD